MVLMKTDGTRLYKRLSKYFFVKTDVCVTDVVGELLGSYLGVGG